MAEQGTSGPPQRPGGPSGRPQGPDTGANLPGKFGHHGEFIPEVTIPQGTQLQAVEHGHEERDINFNSLVGWFSGLAALVVVVIAIMVGTFALLTTAANQANVLPSPVMGVRIVPPEPRLLPNPADSRANPYKPMMGPQYTGYHERVDEIDSLERAGLWDPNTGVPRLPPDALAAVSRENPPAGSPGTAAIDGSKKLMPSASSGGTSVEDELR